MTDSDPAALYDAHLGTALFTPAAKGLLGYAAVSSGESVLDLACGTGRVTRELVPLVGAEGRLAGLDISAAMLDVARTAVELSDAGVDWREGDATKLPFDDGTFDLVVCQQGLQFFPDRVSASSEVARVLKPGGRFAANTWLDLDRQPVEGPLRKSMASRSGIELGAIARPFSFGDEQELRSVLETVGFRGIEISQHELLVEFPLAASFVSQQFEVGAATMSAFADIPEQEWSKIVASVNEDMASILAPYTGADGSLKVPQPTNVVVAYK